MRTTEGAIYVGWDWGKENHQVCVVDRDGEVLTEFRVPHTGDELRSACDRLAKAAEGDPSRIQVGIETPHGAVVDTLLEREIAVYSVNPKQVDRFRDRFTVAGAKDDRLDARVLSDSLRTDARAFRRVEPEHPWTIELREWSRMRDEIVRERVRLTNRVGEQLHRYFPQALELTKDLSVRWFLELWKFVRTPGKAKRVRKKSVDQLLKKHGARRVDGASALEILRQKPPRVADGVVEAATAHIELAVQRLEIVTEQLRRCDRRLDEMLENPLADPATEDEQPTGEQSDAAILLSLPGIGRIVVATLLSEAAAPLRRRDYHALRGWSGAAPVTKSSGKRLTVQMRRACHHRLRNALLFWADAARHKDPWAKAMYAAMRARGQTHSRALRGLGDRLLKVAVAMLRNRETYDPLRRAA